MNTISFNKGNTKIVAHRGVSGLEMENSIAAFVAAGNRSYTGIETDVHVTKDQQIIVIHDDTTLRVTGVDKVVEESTLAELQAIPLYDMQEGTSRTDLHMPLLNEYIDICKKYEKTAVLELKNAMTPDDIRKIVGIIEDCGYLEEVIFISFSWENCVTLRQFLPSQRVQFLTKECDEELMEKLVANKLDLDIHYQALTKEMIDALHAKGIIVNCWTVNDKESGEQLASWGIDYITTNILE